MRGWAILPAALLGAAALVARAPAQEAPAPAGPVHLGAGSCAAQACHGGAFVERQEYKTWATVDRHSRAFDDLTGDIGKRIGDRLGIDPEQAPECLACHGTTGVETAATFDPHDGVSCELCHGAAQAWLGPHAAPAWKKMSPGEKERLGLRDLTTPGKRAALCVGCHIGGPGRDITHAMMAAGHPPLEFDLAAFLQAMPPHWEEKTPASPATTWVEGIKAESAARLGQLSRAARLDYGWPEFAVFDCWSCHHLAYSGSVYERAPLPARPGDLAVGLAGLQTLVIAAGDDVLAKRFDRHVRLAWRPGTPPLELADFAASAAGDVQRILGGRPLRRQPGRVSRAGRRGPDPADAGPDAADHAGAAGARAPARGRGVPRGHGRAGRGAGREQALRRRRLRRDRPSRDRRLEVATGVPLVPGSRWPLDAGRAALPSHSGSSV